VCKRDPLYYETTWNYTSGCHTSGVMKVLDDDLRILCFVLLKSSHIGDGA
jgi:hypothetical protein